MDQHTSQETQLPFNSEAPQPAPNKSRRIVALIVLIITIGIVLGVIYYFVSMQSGKNDQGSGANAANSIRSELAEVDIASGGLVPQTLTVKAGQQVEFKNVDTVGHRLTSDDNKPEDFDSQEAIAVNGSYVYVFDTPGTYHYYDPQDVNKYVGTITVEQ